MRHYSVLLIVYHALYPYLNGMTPLIRRSQRLRRCANDLASFTAEVHRTGLGIVLDRIATCSRGDGDRFQDSILRVLVKLVSAPLLDNRDEGALTIATLNYDGLLTAGLLQLRDECGFSSSDLGDGRSEECVELSHRVALDAWRIREDYDLFGDIYLLHLHGSLGWVSHPNRYTTWKVRIPDLRREEYWTRLREGKVFVTPKLVLTDQKTKVVIERPFSLAYHIFEDRLENSEYWFIGGYGFGDQPVNAVLRRAYWQAQNRRRPPRILIVSPDIRTREKAMSLFAMPRIGREPFEFLKARFPEAVETPELEGFLGYV